MGGGGGLLPLVSVVGVFHFGVFVIVVVVVVFFGGTLYILHLFKSLFSLSSLFKTK